MPRAPAGSSGRARRVMRKDHRGPETPVAEREHRTRLATSASGHSLLLFALTLTQVVYDVAEN